MTEAYLILRDFGNRMAEVHLSEINAASKHEPISYGATRAYQQVASINRVHRRRDRSRARSPGAGRSAAPRSKAPFRRDATAGSRVDGLGGDIPVAPGEAWRKGTQM